MTSIKKSISIIVAVMLFVVSIPITAYADTPITLYAYSSSDSGAEQYAGSMLCSFARAHGYSGSFSDITLGKGISIYNPDDLDKTLFPIWKDGEIVYTLLVLDTGDYYTGSFSESYAEQLGALKNVANQQAPLSLVADDGFYAVVGSKWYDLNGEAGSYAVKAASGQAAYSSVVNACDAVSYVVTPQPRIPTSYRKSFNVFDHQKENELTCYAYCMATILTNMSGGTYANFKVCYDEIKNHVGNAWNTFEKTAEYLSSKQYTYVYRNYQYMTFNEAKYELYNHDSYICIAVALMDEEGILYIGSHALVIFGYYDDGANQFYNIWDPYDLATKTMQVLNVNQFYLNPRGPMVYLWDHGYITNIKGPKQS